MDYERRYLFVLEKVFDNMVDYWHNHDTGMELIEFLGLTMSEYNDIV